MELLIRNGLVNMNQYDIFLVQLMGDGMNMMALNFAMQLVQRYCLEDKGSQFTEVSSSVHLLIVQYNLDIKFTFKTY